MPTKVAVNSGQITINDGSSFLVTDTNGWIDDRLAQGFFVADTRLLSYYEVSIDRDRLLLLASSPLNHHSALYEFTNAELRTLNDGTVPKGKLTIGIRRDIAEGMHEDIDITNYHSERVEFHLMLAIRSDFADIFEVKSQQILSRGETQAIWQDGKLTTDYGNGSFRRGLIVQPDRSGSPPSYANGRLIFRVALDPGQSWHTCINFAAIVGDKILSPPTTCEVGHQTAAKQVAQDFLAGSTQLRSSNTDIAAYYQQALLDMAALRIKVEDDGHDFWMPAAGIPWFVAVFGRDSVVVSMQTMAVHSEFAYGTLLQLAQLQATTVDDWRDAQPGKMPHELRRDELTQLAKLPYSPYYGTIDTTILWISTLAEAYRWSHDVSLLHECRVPLAQALNWIEEYGDFDRDGFVEYQTRSDMGLQNQGWKDSGDAIVHADGSQVESPIALCEVQGYVYAAWKDAATIYDILEEPARAIALRQQADDLYHRFNERFWMEEAGYYCLGLDRHKQQIQAIASNPGQLLWSGIVPLDRVERLVKRLFQTDLWCGWGIRTLSSHNPAYNPLSYQLGSVWPHDNSTIAMGLKRYGYDREANQIAAGIFAAASYFEAGRMPELFAGVERQPGRFPVPYPDANIPQAWAAGSIFLLIRAILGLESNPQTQSLIVRPTLPDWLPDLELVNLKVGTATVTIRFWRQADQTLWKIIDLQGDLIVDSP